jgi:hypothetical protein
MDMEYGETADQPSLAQLILCNAFQERGEMHMDVDRVGVHCTGQKSE